MASSSYITVTDQFCGAGGSSIGAEAAGAELRMALNHWKLAIETHNTNFPNADHDCTDISACDPRRYPATDILITSPECTNHSLAKGKARPHYKTDLFGNVLIDPAEERSRATMWDVVRFAEAHNYEVVIVENVVDARRWVLWDAWLLAMHTLGYKHRCVYFNSMFAHPTPQSRDRMYVVFWKKGNRAPNLDFCPTAWCECCEKDVAAYQWWKTDNPMLQHGRYGPRGQYLYRCPACNSVVRPYYYPALTAIDWSLPIQRIGDRKKPLKEKTLARIRLGLERFAGHYLVLETKYSQARNNRSQPVGEPWPTQTSQQSFALVGTPFLAMLRTESRPRGLNDALQTVVTDNQHFLCDPFLLRMTGEFGHAELSDPLFTQVAATAQQFLIAPQIVKLHNHQTTELVSNPLGTIAASAIHAGLLMPFLTRHFTSEGNLSSSVADPTGTITTQDHHSLIIAEPFLLEMNRSGVRTHNVEASLPTQTASLAHAMIMPAPFVTSEYNGPKRDPNKSLGQVLPTIPSMAVHQLVQPGPAPDVEDCGFRMLEPHEIQTAMAFRSDYVIKGNKRQRIKQLGNAVTPPVMQMIFERVMESLS